MKERNKINVRFIQAQRSQITGESSLQTLTAMLGYDSRSSKYNFEGRLFGTSIFTFSLTQISKNLTMFKLHYFHLTNFRSHPRRPHRLQVALLRVSRESQYGTTWEIPTHDES